MNVIKQAALKKYEKPRRCKYNGIAGLVPECGQPNSQGLSSEAAASVEVFNCIKSSKEFSGFIRAASIKAAPVTSKKITEKNKISAKRAKANKHKAGRASLGFIGGGRITNIILRGLRSARALPRRVVVSDTNLNTLDVLKKEFKGSVITETNNTAAAQQDIVFFAIPFSMMETVLAEIKAYLKPDAIVVSFAPKIKINAISKLLNGFKRIVRMTPNAPSVICRGYNPIAFAKAFTSAERDVLLDFFKIIGDCPQVPEEHLEAYSILTAIGPAYLWFQLYELREIVEGIGLAPKEIEDGLTKMVLGAIETMYRSGLSAGEVMDLIPIKPFGDDEAKIRDVYRTRLGPLYERLKG